MQHPLLKPILTALTSLTLGLSLAATAKAKTVALKFDVTKPVQSTVRATIPSSKPVALTFSPDSPSKPTSQLAISQNQTYPLSDLFTGGPDSLVSKAVGSAEGTRTPTGGYTSAYYGHVDPGNGVAFLDPDTGYWDAPGLGNHWDRIISPLLVAI